MIKKLLLLLAVLAFNAVAEDAPTTLLSSGTISPYQAQRNGHGVVAIDTTPWRAYEHIERLEHICKIVLASKNY